MLNDYHIHAPWYELQRMPKIHFNTFLNNNVLWYLHAPPILQRTPWYMVLFISAQNQRPQYIRDVVFPQKFSRKFSFFSKFSLFSWLNLDVLAEFVNFFPFRQEQTGAVWNYWCSSPCDDRKRLKGIWNSRQINHMTQQPF